MHKHHSALGLATTLSTATRGFEIAKHGPVQPVTLIRPHAASRAARFFVEKFPGRSMYAVKANPSPDLLKVLWESGITHYDVASIAEVRLVARTVPRRDPVLHAPGQGRGSDRRGVFHAWRPRLLARLYRGAGQDRPRHRGAQDLTLCVRLRVSSEHSKLSLASKFGAAPGETKALLFAARRAADALGICFHVGSQAMTPEAYAQAMERVRAAIVDAAVTVDVIDVGGGFPSTYPGMEPPPLERYFETIHRAFESLPVSYSSELWCEPGRALCAEYSSLIVRVERRRGDELYINDGAYGALFDAAHIGWRFPVELLARAGQPGEADGVQLLRPDL